MVTYTLYRQSRFWDPVTKLREKTVVKVCKTFEEAVKLRDNQPKSVRPLLIILPTGDREDMARRIAES